jgi:hypothetical protein
MQQALLAAGERVERVAQRRMGLQGRSARTSRAGRGRCVAVGRFTAGAECRERAEELVDLAEQLLKVVLDPAAYLVEHGGEWSLRVSGSAVILTRKPDA